MSSSSSHYPTKKLDVALTGSDKKQGDETVPTSISPELDNLVVNVSDESLTTSKLSDQEDVTIDEVELRTLTNDHSTEQETVHIHVSTLSDVDDKTAPGTNIIDALSSSSLLHTKIIPKSAPNTIEITTQESSTQGSTTTFSSYIPSTAGKTPN